MHMRLYKLLLVIFIMAPYVMLSGSTVYAQYIDKQLAQNKDPVCSAVWTSDNFGLYFSHHDRVTFSTGIYGEHSIHGYCAFLDTTHVQISETGTSMDGMWSFYPYPDGSKWSFNSDTDQLMTAIHGKKKWILRPARISTGEAPHVNNYANLEALLHIVATCTQIIGTYLGIILLVYTQKEMKASNGKKLIKRLIAVSIIIIALATPCLLNWLIASAHEAKLFISTF